MYLITGVIFLVVIAIALSVQKNNNNTEKIFSIEKIYQESELCTQKDLEQNVNTTNTTKDTISDEKDLTITSEGIYLISGTIIIKIKTI